MSLGNIISDLLTLSKAKLNAKVASCTTDTARLVGSNFKDSRVMVSWQNIPLLIPEVP